MSTRVAFVTGAGSGMGRLYAVRLLQEGWRVAAVDISAEALASLAGGGALLRLVADVRDYEAVTAAVQQAEQQLGPIDRVVNCAAIMPLGALLDTDPSTVRRLFDVNVMGLVNVSQATMPRLLARGAGEFVSFASLAGLVPIFFMGAYGATKSAVISYTETLHQETRGRGVQVVCVCPPAVQTPLLQQGRDTRWPAFLDVLPPIEPARVIEAVERALRRGRFWVFPGWYTRASLIARRWTPGMLWWIVRRIERPETGG
jgi:NAD(P)-dependent dehydrogenase (short-subunit alcohol dehydrogenase family)